ncbi:hypothetical protein HMPREF1153_0760 [Selenomonas sp. CM52]|nr:hypothetical protein HMPREF1153_0760 [Selenomonas sp. CM52]
MQESQTCKGRNISRCHPFQVKFRKQKSHFAASGRNGFAATLKLTSRFRYRKNRYPSPLTVAAVPAYSAQPFGGLSQDHSPCASRRSSHLPEGSSARCRKVYKATISCSTIYIYTLDDLKIDVAIIKQSCTLCQALYPIIFL